MIGTVLLGMDGMGFGNMGGRMGGGGGRTGYFNAYGQKNASKDFSVF